MLEAAWARSAEGGNSTFNPPFRRCACDGLRFADPICTALAVASLPAAPYFQHSTGTVNFLAAAATSAGANAGSEGAVS